jgi:predicted phosphodiesterase
MKKVTLKQSILFPYLEKFSSADSRTLSRKIFKENKSVWKDAETIRSSIRYYRGQKGGVSRKDVLGSPVKDKFFKKGKTEAWNKIPEGEKHLDWDNPVVVKGKKALVLSDVHIPYHDKEALVLALEEGQRAKVDVIYLNGDILDCYQLSRWVRDPRMRRFGEELTTARKVLSLIRKNFPKAKIYFKHGNHELRYELYMIQKAPELLDIPEFELNSILRLKQMDITPVGAREWAKIGKLPIAHGHEGGRSFTNPVSASRGIFLKSIESILVGHYHQPSSYTDNTWTGKPITCWSTGCLCDLHPTFMPKNKWAHGFAIVELIDNKGNYIVENKRIYKNRILPV